MTQQFSRFAHTVSYWAGQPVVFLSALAVVLMWMLTGPMFHYSDTWQLVINTGTTIVTFLMVFLIQNTQNRDTLAIQPIRVLGGDLSGTAIAAVVGLAVAAVLLAGMMGRPWAWHGGTVLQGLLLLAGFLHWSLGVLGLVFGLVWLYVLHVRRTILG